MNDLQLFSKEVQKLTLQSAIQIDNPNKKGLSAIAKIDVALDEKLETVLDYFAQILGHNPAIDFILPILSEEIKKAYYFLTFEEICYVLKKGIAGYYKNPAQIAPISFNIETVLSWLADYTDKERNPFVTAYKPKQEIEAVNPYEHAAENLAILDKIHQEAKEAKEKRNGIVKPKNDAENTASFEAERTKQTELMKSIYEGEKV